jgi:hypothetical protein
MAGGKLSSAGFSISSESRFKLEQALHKSANEAIIGK